MANYTPAPWSYGLFNHHDSALKIAAPVSDNRMFVAEVFYRREKPLLDYTAEERRQMAAEQNANARLIAAAPELLEALKELAAWANLSENHERWGYLATKVNIAIRRAEEGI